MTCALAADTKLETPEGPLTVRTIVRVPCAVMTVTDDGKVRFHMTKKAHQVGERRPVLRISVDNGRALRVGAEQILFAADMRPMPAGEVRRGDRLASVFVFPAGYTYRADDGREVTAAQGIAVTSVEPDGEADVFSLAVNKTGRFAFSAGVLGKADAD